MVLTSHHHISQMPTPLKLPNGNIRCIIFPAKAISRVLPPFRAPKPKRIFANRNPSVRLCLSNAEISANDPLKSENRFFKHETEETSSKPLSWEKRMKIAKGVARGLQYLHANNIIHRDMRPNNILITHDYESRLGDFGLARTQYEDSAETRVVGTLGYLAPEYAEFGKVSTKSDVYAFGVVLLQLITGLRTMDMIFEGRNLVGWVVEYFNHVKDGDPM